MASTSLPREWFDSGVYGSIINRSNPSGLCLQADEDDAMGMSATEPPHDSRIWTDVDLDREGKSFGYLRLNVSSHERASSFVPIPVAVFKNGAGPRILLLGGVHGDEYEGQVMLMKLMRTLDIANVRGHLIIMSAANAPAAYAGRRTSPLDDGN